jgi:hypothetical protein
MDGKETKPEQENGSAGENGAEAKTASADADQLAGSLAQTQVRNSIAGWAPVLVAHNPALLDQGCKTDVWPQPHAQMKIALPVHVCMFNLAVAIYTCAAGGGCRHT